jgi:hypothetical protein
VYDLDDDLLNVPRTHPNAGDSRPRAKVVRRMLDLSDVVWLSTDGLAERLASIRPDAVVIENRLDERIWTHTPPVCPRQDEPLRVLCMGTTTHDRDFAMIRPALVRLKDEFGDRIVIDILGMTSRGDLPVGFNRIGPPFRAFRSYPGFVHWLTSVMPRWHIGLAPLLDTSFNRCKSSVKAMDYAAMGMFTVASDMAVYRDSIADGPAGTLVANDPLAWYAELSRRLRNRDWLLSAATQTRQAFLEQASLASHVKLRRAAWRRALATKRTDAAA